MIFKCLFIFELYIQDQIINFKYYMMYWYIKESDEHIFEARLNVYLV